MFEAPSNQSGRLTKLFLENTERMETNNALLDELLISKNGYHHLLYQEVLDLMSEI